MDKTNFTEFIKQSDNGKNSNQEAKVEYHSWRLLSDQTYRDHRIIDDWNKMCLERVGGIINDERSTEKAVANTLHLMQIATHSNVNC